MQALALPALLERVTNVSDPDRERAERFRSGDRSAFDVLVRKHQKGVWRIVRRYVRRDAKGQFKESDDAGRANSQDRQRDAENETRSGQGDRGDRSDRSDR